MNNEELLEWGLKEAAIRKDELSDIRSEAHLKQIQARVADRRKAAGLSRSDATYAIIEASRHLRLQRDKGVKGERP